jgi:hypothetical protein
LLKPYHVAWLSVHPDRSEEWLETRLSEGFDIHHLDGDHGNNDPTNLVLIEHGDHMMLHGGRKLCRLARKKPQRRKAVERKLTRRQVDKMLTDWRLTRAYCS